jgi:glycosyltransferase involved in cell wall biosynthesis
MQVESRREIKVSIGILAHNEELVIGGMLESLFTQTIFKPEGKWRDSIEVICLPNGCTDQTLTRINDGYKQASLIGIDESLIAKELIEPGKANAWNVLVHEMVSASTQYIVLLDADIELGSGDVLERMLDALELNSHAVIAVDEPKKDVVKKADPTFYEKFLMGIATSQTTDCPAICGQLYVGRASALRKLFLPKGLTVEDGFLRLMILTDGLTLPQDCRKIVLVPSAFHYFETVYGLGELLDHEVRIIGGTVINHLLRDYLSKKISEQGGDACSLARDFSNENPDWVANYINELWQAQGIGALPKRMWTRRFYWPQNQTFSPARWLKTFIRSIPEWVLLVLVLIRMRNRQLVGRW